MSEIQEVSADSELWSSGLNTWALTDTQDVKDSKGNLWLPFSMTNSRQNADIFPARHNSASGTSQLSNEMLNCSKTCLPESKGVPGLKNLGSSWAPVCALLDGSMNQSIWCSSDLSPVNDKTQCLSFAPLTWSGLSLADSPDAPLTESLSHWDTSKQASLTNPQNSSIMLELAGAYGVWHSEDTDISPYSITSTEFDVSLPLENGKIQTPTVSTSASGWNSLENQTKWSESNSVADRSNNTSCEPSIPEGGTGKGISNTIATGAVDNEGSTKAFIGNNGANEHLPTPTTAFSLPNASFAFDDDPVLKLINTHDGWGTRPVDQSIPWDISTTCATSSIVVSSRTASTTPVPFNQPSLQPQQLMLIRRGIASMPTSDDALPESGVWTSEPPNGTGIWEAHYESMGQRTARWQQQNASQIPSNMHPQLHPTLHHDSFFSQNHDNSITPSDPNLPKWRNLHSSSGLDSWPGAHFNEQTLSSGGEIIKPIHVLDSVDSVGSDLWSNTPTQSHSRAHNQLLSNISLDAQQTVSGQQQNAQLGSNNIPGLSGGIRSSNPLLQQLGSFSLTQSTSQFSSVSIAGAGTNPFGITNNNTRVNRSGVVPHQSIGSRSGNSWSDRLAGSGGRPLLGAASSRPGPPTICPGGGVGDEPFDEQISTSWNSSVASGNNRVGSSHLNGSVGCTDSWGGEWTDLAAATGLIENQKPGKWHGHQRPMPISSWQSNNNANSNSGNRPLLQLRPHSNTYRADSVRHFMSLGYRKEDVQACLIECNMDIERVAAMLCERYQPSPAAGAAHSASSFSRFSGQSLNGPNGHSICPDVFKPMLEAGASLSPGDALGFRQFGAVAAATASAASTAQPQQTHNRLPASVGMVGQLATQHPNSAIMRHQITQQVRSALNFSSLPGAIKLPLQQHSHISGPSNSSSACQGSHLTLHGPSSSNSMHPVGLGVGINGGSVAGGGGAGTSGNVTVGAQVSSGGSSGTSLLGQPPPASSATPVMLTNSISGAFGNCMPSVNPSNVNSGPSSRHFSMNTGSNNINNHPGNSGSRSRKLLHHQQQQSQQQQQHHSGQSHFSQHLPVSSSVHVGAASTLSSGMLAGHSVGATTGSGQLMLGLNASGTHARPTSLQMTGSTNSGLPSATANAPSGSAAAVAAAVTAASLISAELRKKQLLLYHHQQQHLVSPISTLNPSHNGTAFPPNSLDADSSSLFRLLHSSGAPSSAVAAVAAAAAAAVSAGLPLDSHLSAVSGMSARSAASSQIGGLGQRNPSTGGQGISGPSIGHGLSGQTLSSTSVASNGIMLPQSHSSCAVGSGSGGNTQQQQRQLVQMLMELQLKSQNSSNGLSNGLISAEDIMLRRFDSKLSSGLLNLGTNGLPLSQQQQHLSKCPPPSAAGRLVNGYSGRVGRFS